MTTYPSLVQVGTVGGVPVMADASPGGFSSIVKVVIGATAYIAGKPPGWPIRPGDMGTGGGGEGSSFTVAAGATFAFHNCEAAALVNANFAAYA